MPHAVQKQKILERLKSLDGKAKVREIRLILSEIPQYKSGPYGELRGWLLEEIEKASVKSKVKAREFFAVKKQGDFQICFIGQPSSGKTSLINALSNAELKTGAYAFTTLKPQAATIHVFGVDFQLIDLPGLIEGAAFGKGFGKRVLAVARNADGFIFVDDLSRPVEELRQIINELESYGGKGFAKSKPAMIIANKTDLPIALESIKELRKEFSDFDIVEASALEKKNIECIKNGIWKLSGLIRVYSKGESSRPVALYPGATVKDFTERIHKELVESFNFARIWGKSAIFPGQKVGLAHELNDNDVVEIVGRVI